MEYTLTCNGQAYAVASSAELASRLETACRADDAELWLNRVDGAALCVLVNRDQAWLMFLQSEGDAGFSSRNPNDAGSPDAKVEFLLSNGQWDEYPVQWCIATAEALQAMRYFFEQGEKSPLVAWHED